MRNESWNIIGVDNTGDWLIETVDGLLNANNKVKAHESDPRFKRVYTVKCSA